jgi:hypothetical protein
MFRNGWDNNIKDADAIPALANGSKARPGEVNGDETAKLPLATTSTRFLKKQLPAACGFSL